MVTVLFWNIDDRTEVLPHLSCLATKHGVDIFFLTECPADNSVGLVELNGLDIGSYHETFSGVSKVRALTRLGDDRFRHRFTGTARDLTVWSLRAERGVVGAEILLGAVHLPSRFGGASDADQAVAAHEVVAELDLVEDRAGHRNTALVGDFNMNPYDHGMTSTTGFQGQMTRQLAGQPDRVYRGQDRRRFYNPMWGLFGDRTEGPPGSHYWDSSVSHNPHWHLLDQLLLRKELMNQLAELRILTEDGIHSLVDARGIPNRERFSDHLPILFRLDV